LKHKPTFIDKDDASILPSGFFLYVAISGIANYGFVPHSAPWLYELAFDNSNPKHEESSRHGLDDTLYQIDIRLPRLSVAMSIVDLHTHEQLAPSEVVREVSPSVPGTNEEVALDGVSPPAPFSRLSLLLPSSVLQRMAMILLAGLLLECPGLVPRGILPTVFAPPILLHFLLVS